MKLLLIALAASMVVAAWRMIRDDDIRDDDWLDEYDALPWPL